jgi:hypothetical protein
MAPVTAFPTVDAYRESLSKGDELDRTTARMYSDSELLGVAEMQNISIGANRNGHIKKKDAPQARPLDKVWSASELLTTAFPEPRWAVRGIVAEGVNLLAGAPKLGKSWMALNIAQAIAAGGRALGWVPVEQGPVLYLALEDTPRRLASRLRMVLGDDPIPPGLDFKTHCDSLPDGGEKQIRDWLDEHGDARLVIVDVLTRLRGRVSDRADRYQVDYHAMAAVKKIADDSKVPFLVVHHTRKASAEDFLDLVNGTHGLAGAADAVLVLQRSRNSADAVLHLTGRDVEEAKYALRFAPGIGTWTLCEGPAEDYELAETRRRILTAVRETPETTPKEIAERLGIKDDNARQAMSRMVKDGQLTTDGEGRYSAPPTPVTPVTPVTEAESDTRDTCDSPPWTDEEIGL